MLGIYEMDASNTRGVKGVLEENCLECIPEAHCYLRDVGKRIDITRVKNPLIVELIFLYEMSISPEQIGSFKSKTHKKFVEQWATQRGLTRNLDELWSIRERCITALTESE